MLPSSTFNSEPDRIYLQPAVTRRLLIAFVCAAALLLLAELLDAIVEPHVLGKRFLFGYGTDIGFVRLGEDRIGLRRTPGREIWDQQYAITKVPGNARIIVIGDSVARGGSYESSFAGQLGELLGQQGRPSQVWSLCAPGYGSRRKHLLAQEALRYQPDLLIYHLNVSTEYEDEREWQRYQDLASWHPKNWLGKLPLLGSMKQTKTEKFFWQWFSTQARQRAGVHDSAARLDALRAKSNFDEWLPPMVQQFEQTLAMAKAANVPVLVLARASVDPSKEALTDHGLDRIAADHISVARVAFVSSKQTFDAEPIAKVFADGAHWHDYGHRLMAAALLEPAKALIDAGKR